MNVAIDYKAANEPLSLATILALGIIADDAREIVTVESITESE